MRDASLDEFFTDSAEESEADTEDEADESDRETETGDETEPRGVDHGPEPEPESESDPETEAGIEDGNESENETEGPPPVADAEPARSTYAWSPDGAACAACGEQAEERWESESGPVCVACKEW